jgi:menaquinol-cytochrome c reductase cytochrome b/c subunit
MYKWVMAVLFFGGCLFGAGYLILAPSDKMEGEGEEVVAVKKATEIVMADDPAYKNVYSKSTCVMCHGTDLKGGPGAPTLINVGAKYDKEAILGIIKNGIGGMGAQYDANIGKGLTDADLTALADWLGKQKAE